MPVPAGLTDAGAFITPEEVATLAQTDLDRATVELLIRGTEAAVRRHCGWSITEETVTGQVLVPVGGYLFIPTLHLTALAIVENGVALTAGDGGFTWTVGGVVKRGYGSYGSYVHTGWWSPLWQAIVGTYTHGYPDGAPQLDDIKDIVGSAVARRIGNPEILSQLTVGNVSETYAVGPQLPSIALLRMEKEELAPYTLIAIG